MSGGDLRDAVEGAGRLMTFSMQLLWLNLGPKIFRLNSASRDQGRPTK
jgi:hypothetical protein